MLTLEQMEMNEMIVEVRERRLGKGFDFFHDRDSARWGKRNGKRQYLKSPGYKRETRVEIVLFETPRRFFSFHGFHDLLKRNII